MKFTALALVAASAAMPAHATDIAFSLWNDFDIDIRARFFTDTSPITTVGGNPAQHVRSFAEFDYAGREAGSWTLSFKLVDKYHSGGEFPRVPTIWDLPTTIADLSAYAADGTSGPPLGADWSAPKVSLGSFATAAAKPGDVLSFDVSELFNAGKARGDVAFGVQINSLGRGLSGFDAYGLRLTDFQLTSAVPEPETYALLLAGVAVLAARVRRRRPD